MGTKKNFLVEIGTEELPARSLRSLAESFAKNFSIEMDNASLSYKEVRWFATPRRLSLLVFQLVMSQPDRKIEKIGPSLSIGFDENGVFTKAAICWAKKNDINISETEQIVTNKGQWLVYRTLVKGKQTQVLLPNIVANSLRKLPILKLMRWGNGKVQFVRPVHNIILLLGDELISANILSVRSDRLISGHRFMGEQKIIINNADQYLHLLLERGKVIADYSARKSKIKTDIEIAALQLNGIADLNDPLLEEVTSLVEWPVVLTAKFEEKFLNIPNEVLIHTMKIHQKYFPIYDENRKLLPYFIFVVNIESKDKNQIIIGNEKVVRSRFSDAEFFFQTDRKQRLENNLLRLKTVLFHKELGTLRDKTERIHILSKWIALRIGANIEHTMRASILSKCDLMTNMVFEFPDMQGIMGMHYARYDGEDDEVALAIKEQYQPRFSGDSLPSSLVGCALSIADKIDTLVGIFSIKQYPKGAKDPFALRRSALGVLKIIIEKKLNIDLKELIKEAAYLYRIKLINIKFVNDIFDFMLSRLRSWYQEKNYSIDIIQSVIAICPARPIDFDGRIIAISQLRNLENVSALVVINKRINNILFKEKEILNDNVKFSLLKEKAEIQLANFIITLRKKLRPYFITGLYQDALIEMTPLHDLINAFFEKVIVNTTDTKLRINRLTLLSEVRTLLLQIADFSLLI